MTREPRFAVWYASVGCLPDACEPEYVGSLEDCEVHVNDQLDDPDVPAIGGAGDTDGNLYTFSIEPYDDDEDDQDEDSEHYCWQYGHDADECPNAPVDEDEDEPTRPGFELSEYWVCEDCYLTHNGALDCADEPTDCEPLCLLPSDVDVTNWTDSETGEGIDGFSWDSCDGCGSTLGGSRYRLAVWEPKPLPLSAEVAQ